MPVRKVRASHRSMTGLHMVPGSRAIRCESMLEMDFVTLHLFDDGVAMVEEQPVRIPVPGRSRGYVPDFLVTYREPSQAALLAEVKPAAVLKDRGPHFAERFAAADAFARHRGWRFEIFDEHRIRTPRLQNARFLQSYRARRFDRAVGDRLLALAEPGVSLQSLMDCGWPDLAQHALYLADLWGLIATGRIVVDLDQPLFMTSIIREVAHG